jgi:predicted glutamine amidotransferase
MTLQSIAIHIYKLHNQDITPKFFIPRIHIQKITYVHNSGVSVSQNTDHRKKQKDGNTEEQGFSKGL